MKTETMTKRIAGLVPTEETILAATKAIPRGSIHEVILGAAGAVAGGSVTPALFGAGSALGSAAAQGVGDAGREERAEAGVDVGHASHVLVVVTDGSLLWFALSAFGRPKELTARLERHRVTGVREEETTVFGQKMMEIVVTTDTGAEVGFGVAKVHRSHGRAVLAALS